MDNRLQFAFENRHGRHKTSDPAKRGKLFKPFAALKGYYDLIEGQERVKVEKHELTEEEANALSQVASCLRKGDLVRVEHYVADGYKTTIGVVRQADITLGKIRLVNGTIDMDSIWHLEAEAAEG